MLKNLRNLLSKHLIFYDKCQKEDMNNEVKDNLWLVCTAADVPLQMLHVQNGITIAATASNSMREKLWDLIH